METPSRHSFDLDGALRIFPIPSPIKGDNYCRIEVDGVIINDRTTYDIVNNSIVFLNTSLLPNGSQLDVLVVQSEEAIGQLAITTNIDIVASNITDVNTVGQDITNVDIVATNITGVNTLATNIAEVLQADTNAATATTQAGIATTKATEASNSATAAANSATQAATSESNAEGYKDTVVAKEALVSPHYDAIDSAYANIATIIDAPNQAVIATTQAGVATTQASNALASATAAQTALDTFTGQYHGALATAPTAGLDAGDLYFDTTANEMRVYDGLLWKAAGSAINGTTKRQSFTATAGQTTFTVAGGYDAGFADVYLNGVKLVNGVDADVTSGTDIVLTVGATAGDTVDVVAYGAFEVANTYTKAETDTIVANIDALPDQTGHADQYLKSNGTTADWANVGAIGGIFYENDQIVTADYTITAGKNAGSFGPITIADNVTVTVPTGSNWSIV